MTFDDEIRLQFEQCSTIEELKSALRRVIAKYGQDDRLLKGILLGFFGGHVVRVDAQGVPLNPWRRKFLHPNQEVAQPEPERLAA